MIRRPPRSTPFPTRRSSDLGVVGGAEVLERLLPPGPEAALEGLAELRVDLLAAVRDCELGDQESGHGRSEEHTSELQSRQYLVCRLLLEKKKIKARTSHRSR